MEQNKGFSIVDCFLSDQAYSAERQPYTVGGKLVALLR